MSAFDDLMTMSCLISLIRLCDLPLTILAKGETLQDFFCCCIYIKSTMSSSSVLRLDAYRGRRRKRKSRSYFDGLEIHLHGMAFYILPGFSFLFFPYLPSSPSCHLHTLEIQKMPSLEKVVGNIYVHSEINSRLFTFSFSYWN